LFSYVDIEARIPTGHPIRIIGRIVNEVLVCLDAERPYPLGSVAPQLHPTSFCVARCYRSSSRSTRSAQPMEQLDYNLMFRWFVGLGIDDPVWDHSVYAKNRDRLLEANIARKFMKGIIAHPEVAPLLSERTLRGRWYARQCLGLAQELRAQGQRFRGQRVEAS